ncbi:hypothetical protein ACET3Z_013421 [Daucus carota]
MIGGSGNWSVPILIVIAQPFGRVFELWSLDMGLGPVDQQFMAVNEADLAPEVVDGEMDQEDDVVGGVAAGAVALANGGEHEVIEILD